jgi:hypothetical protein
MVSKVFSILNFVKKQMMKTDKDGIMRLPGELKSKYGEAVIIRQLVEAGVDPRTIKNEQQLIGILDSIDAMKARRTTKPGTTGIMGTKEAGVFDLKGNRLDPNKKITGGTQETEDMIKQKLEEQNKKAVKDFKKKMEDTEDKADGGRIGFFTAGLAAGDEISPGTASKQKGGGPTRRDDGPDLSSLRDDKPNIPQKKKDKPPVFTTGTSFNKMGVTSLSPAILARIARMGKKIRPIFGGDVGLEYADEVGDATTNFKIIQDIEDLIKEKKLNPELKYKKEIGDDTLIEGGLDAQGDFNIFLKKKFADGGRIGLKDGMDRRTFMKIMGGLASLPVLGKFFKGAEKAAPVAGKVMENFSSKASEAPQYFFDLVSKIKMFGKRSKVGPSERVDEYSYIGKNGDEYTLTEDIVTGDAQITKDKMGIGTSGDKSFDTINDRTVLEYKAPKKDVDVETQRMIDEGAEYEEYKIEFDQDGTQAGADAVDEIIQKEIIEEATKSAPPIKKAAGGLAYMLGE